MTLGDAYDLIESALQADLEHGVKWLNEAASREFTDKYPELVKAIDMIAEAADELDEV